MKTIKYSFFDRCKKTGFVDDSEWEHIIVLSFVIAVCDVYLQID